MKKKADAGAFKTKLKKALKKPQKQKMKFTLVFEVEYEGDPETYTDPDPVKMAEEDKAAAESQPFVALQGMMQQPGASFNIKCEALQSVGQKAGLELETKA
jgi:hypothetical protein